MASVIAPTVRTATRADLDALVSMGCDFLANSVFGDIVGANPAVLRELGERLLHGSEATILVLEHGGAVAGMLGLICAPHFLSGRLYVGEVCWWTTPASRGYGRLLLAAAEAWAREQGAHFIQMIAPDARVGMLYQRRGYAPAETTWWKSLA